MYLYTSLWLWFKFEIYLYSRYSFVPRLQENNLNLSHHRIISLNCRRTRLRFVSHLSDIFLWTTYLKKKSYITPRHSVWYNLFYSRKECECWIINYVLYLYWIFSLRCKLHFLCNKKKGKLTHFTLILMNF